MTFILPDECQVVRRVKVDPSGVVVTDAPEDTFNSNLVRPLYVQPTEAEDSPRNISPYTLQYAAEPLGPGANAPTGAGERVQTQGETWETLGRPRSLSSGRRILGMQIAVQRISTLYPYAGDIQDRSGFVLTPDVPLAMWGGYETVSGTGSYEATEAECPVEFFANLKPNNVIVVGGVRYHIARFTTVLQGPRVRMTLRRRDSVG